MEEQRLSDHIPGCPTLAAHLSCLQFVVGSCKVGTKLVGLDDEVNYFIYFEDVNASSVADLSTTEHSGSENEYSEIFQGQNPGSLQLVLSFTKGTKYAYSIYEMNGEDVRKLSYYSLGGLFRNLALFIAFIYSAVRALKQVIRR